MQGLLLFQADGNTVNDDAKIDIRILLNDGTTLAILFAGKTPYDNPDKRDILLSPSRD